MLFHYVSFSSFNLIIRSKSIYPNASVLYSGKYNLKRKCNFFPVKLKEWKATNFNILPLNVILFADRIHGKAFQ